MSFIKSPDVREQRETEVYFGDELVTVHFDYHEWSEGHPYGEGSAYQTHSDCSGHWFLVDGEEKSYRDLVHSHGAKTVDEAIKLAEEIA